MSVIALGCGGFGGVGSEAALFGKGETEDEAGVLMDRAYESGINYFDTANAYGGGLSEEMVGRWLDRRGLRQQIFLATKVGTALGTAPNQGGLSRRHIVDEVEHSLRRLRTDWIDLYMAHQVDPDTALEDTLSAFDSLVVAGKVRYVGICNCEAWRLGKACWVADRHGLHRFDSVQNQYNLLTRHLQSECTALAADQQIAFTAHSPLAGGWLTGKYMPGGPPDPKSRLSLRPGPYEHFRNRRTAAEMVAFKTAASEAGMTMTTLAIAWLVSDPAVTSVLIGPRHTGHLDEAVTAAEQALDESARREVVHALDDAERGLD